MLWKINKDALKDALLDINNKYYAEEDRELAKKMYNVFCLVVPAESSSAWCYVRLFCKRESECGESQFTIVPERGAYFYARLNNPEGELDFLLSLGNDMYALCRISESGSEHTKICSYDNGCDFGTLMIHGEEVEMGQGYVYKAHTYRDTLVCDCDDILTQSTGYIQQAFISEGISFDERHWSEEYDNGINTYEAIVRL